MIARPLLGVALLTGCVTQSAEIPTQEGGAALAEELRGRTAGPELSCVSSHELRGTRLIRDSDAILFEARGDVIYVNRPPGGCAGLAPDLSLRTSTPTGLLCQGDIIEAFDATTGVSHASCSLGAFVPYRRLR